MTTPIAHKETWKRPRVRELAINTYLKEQTEKASREPISVTAGSLSLGRYYQHVSSGNVISLSQKHANQMTTNA